LHSEHLLAQQEVYLTGPRFSVHQL
jgi:hypothetical protein